MDLNLNDPNYIQRRDHLLKIMKKTNWDVEDEKPKSNKGRKPKPAPERAKPDLTKPRNKFFKF